MSVAHKLVMTATFVLLRAFTLLRCRVLVFGAFRSPPYPFGCKSFHKIMNEQNCPPNDFVGRKWRSSEPSRAASCSIMPPAQDIELVAAKVG